MDTKFDKVWPDVHFSDLKRMALSPAHVKAALAAKFESTRAMKVGTVMHHLVLGPRLPSKDPRDPKPLIKFDGDRRSGKVWEKFEADYGATHEIVTIPEWNDAIPMADAVMADKEARSYLDGARLEVPLRWESQGVWCATGGVDFLHDDWFGDLKSTTCTEPEAWRRHAWKLLYPQQLAFSEEGVIAKGFAPKKRILIGVESDPPYVVTCLSLTERLMDHARRSVALWLERLIVSRENDFWPGYTQTTVEFDLPAWFGADDDEEDP